MFKDSKHPKVKFCGITTLQDARFASGMLVDYLGFIFYENSPRYLDPAKAGAIINWIEGPEFVGVFVNQALDDVNAISRQTGIDLVQLHGNESPDYCGLVDKPIIKAIHVEKGDTASDMESRIKPYLGSVDYLLFDTKVGGKWGGTGQSFDWSLLEDVSQDIPFFLSGGLSADNIRTACETVQPYAIDVSSGIEAEPGVKDFDKIEALMEEIR
ncbi:MAG TPA: phosphoribosylanthranilate isomerase [Balneolaceae bacterium]